MDDDEGKARRNLVLASTVVLLAAWLELPLPGLIEKVTSLKAGESISPARAWAAVLAVLVYLVYRYDFSEEAAKGRETLKQAWEAALADLIAGLLNRHLNRAARGGRDSPHFDHKLREYFAHQREFGGYGKGKGSLQVPHAGAAAIKMETTPWQGTVSVPLQGSSDAGATRSSSGNRLPFNLSNRVGRAQVIVPAALLVALRSKATTSALAPVVLSMLAVGVAVFRLTSALL